MQDLLHGHRKQVKEPTSDRWLSVETAAKIILEYYNSIIMCLENADAKQDPKAVALYYFMASSLFLLITALCDYALCDWHTQFNISKGHQIICGQYLRL